MRMRIVNGWIWLTEVNIIIYSFMNRVMCICMEICARVQDAIAHHTPRPPLEYE